MRFLLALALCSSLLAHTPPPAAAAEEAAPGRTLLFLDADGALRMANIAEENARIPTASLAPGKSVRRFVVSHDGARALIETPRPDGLSGVFALELAARRLTSLGAGLTLPGDGGPNPFSGDGRRVALRRQNRDEVALFSAGTGRPARTLPVPGLQGSPAWFGDAYHLAAVSHPPEGGTLLAIFDARTGALSAEAMKDETKVPLRYEGMRPGLMVFRETREGLDGWLGVRADGTIEAVDEPVPPGLPTDLPAGVEAAVSPGGEWVAYVQENGLHLRANAEGAEAVRLASASALLWKPGDLLPERAAVPAVAAPGPALVPGVLTLSVAGGEAVEGESFEIAWQADPRVAWVTLSARVERTPKGGVARGSYTQPMARVAASEGRYVWQVPWLDNVRFSLRADALNESRQVIGRAQQDLSFRPAEMAGEYDDGIYVHLSRASRQRLYVQEEGRLTMVFLCSGASTGRILPGDQHPDDPHDHFGTFRVQGKDPDHVSNLDPTWKMPYAMRYLGGHWIHVTARNQYYRLGRPGSHGCVRLHMADGRRLYQRTPIGETVRIY